MSNTENPPTELDEVVARIEAEVAENDQVDRSAELLIGQLAQQLRDAASGAEDAASDPDAPTEEAGSPVLTALIAKLNGLADSLDSSQGRLSAAVVAGTPASPLAPEPVPSQAAVDAAIESGAVTVPTAPAPEPVQIESGFIDEQVQPDPPAGTADLGSPSEGNEDDPAFNASAGVTTLPEVADEEGHVAETETATE